MRRYMSLDLSRCIAFVCFYSDVNKKAVKLAGEISAQHGIHESGEPLCDILVNFCVEKSDSPMLFFVLRLISFLLLDAKFRGSFCTCPCWKRDSLCLVLSLMLILLPFCYHYRGC